MPEEQTAPLDIKFQQRFSKNLVSNIVYFILQFIVGIALVPFFLDSLGQVAYALVPLATSITSYVTLVVSCLNGSVSRFLTLDLQRGDITKANITYNTALFGTLAVVLIFVPIALVIALATPYIFSTGDQSVLTVFVLFALVFLAAFIRTWTSTFQVTLFAHNRLDLWNWVNASYIIAQVIVVVILFIVLGPSLPLIGVSYFIAAIFSGILAATFSKKINPLLKIQASLFKVSLFKEMGILTGWFTFQQLGTLLKLPVCIIIVNLLFGEIAETQFSIAQTFISLLLGVSALLTNTFRPQIYAFVANHDNLGAKKFIVGSIRITVLCMALPIAMFCVFAPEVLTIWVGAEYADLASLVCVLVLIPVILDVAGGCIGPLNVACNKVRATAIANFIAALINIGLALTIPFIFDIGMYGVAIAWVISMVLYITFGFIYNAYIIDAPALSFVKPALSGLIAVSLLFIAGMIARNCLSIDSLMLAIVLGIAISCIYLILLSKVIFRKDEIKEIRALLPAFINRLIPKWLF